MAAETRTATLCGGEPRNAPAIRRPTAPRRGLLAALLALPATAGTGLALGASSAHAAADAALLDACAELRLAYAAAEAAEADDSVSDDAIGAIARRWDAAIDRVTEAQAHTVAGLQAKGAALLLVLAREVPALQGCTVDDFASPHELLAWSLAGDLAELGEA